LRKEIKSWIRTVIFSIIIAVTILQFFSFFLVSGSSMMPTFENNDYLIVKKQVLGNFEYKKNDIIIFKVKIKSNKDLVKRIIATEGDHIQIVNDVVYVNDKMLKEKYILSNETKGNIDLFVNNNCFFVMGDNREVSFDSRSESVGEINIENVLGKVILKMFPIKWIGDENDEN
jgi:signal peptidase I